MTKKIEKKKMKTKWKVVIAITIAQLIAGCVLWYISTDEARTANAEFQQLTDYANRQTVEIAIIQQAAELRRLRAELVAEQQKTKSDVQDKLNPK